MNATNTQHETLAFELTGSPDSGRTTFQLRHTKNITPLIDNALSVPARTTTPTLIDVSARSSFIDSFAYQGTTDGLGFLAIFFKAGHAALYRGVPPTIPGLLAAGHTNSQAHKVLSVGATYNRLIKGVYDSMSVSEPEKVVELRKLMGGK